ncbi:hypothetical protein M899_1868 [Bacteriovorax sp. BSW11_IV]|uniref:hypothetical protein n=1 Tax=Bacteriovorax sp. BSW11_IV TaxID=1353529 RepID=UPI00038A54F6|nr:hypothetical protein [Bacteriovorax sp. BSW11_IV]EQC48523.1 hypothetical protein M899_1868 [Bacteriovorax sp. BSW11_IV]
MFKRIAAVALLTATVIAVAAPTKAPRPKKLNKEEIVLKIINKCLQEIELHAALNDCIEKKKDEARAKYNVNFNTFF